jgi:Cu(I)/Ag(I) efflux system periplasmic protein CusF
MRVLTVVLTASLLLVETAHAQVSSDLTRPSPDAPRTLLAQAGMIEGEVRKLDMSAGKITLRHGPIPQHGMNMPMTMVFPMKDPAAMSGLNVGDKVLFGVVKEGGSLTVTEIKKTN